MTNFAFSVALVLLLLGFLSITKFIALFNLNSVMEAYFYILSKFNATPCACNMSPIQCGVYNVLYTLRYIHYILQKCGNFHTFILIHLYGRNA